MPNYVINTIQIEGEQFIIDELLSSVKSDESDFDFENIVPSPKDKNWYEWNCKYWGTKWNSSDSYSCGNTISFQTAWSTPYPVIDELSKKYPTLIFITNYADEDIGSNCGTYKLQNGNLLEDIKGDTVFACEMWGYDPAEYDEAYARDKRIDEIIK